VRRILEATRRLPVALVEALAALPGLLIRLFLSSSLEASANPRIRGGHR
jgi:hypothetical protein